ncbi:sugar ABC transporter substrate-binding protein [candidate division KSB1 bacterium]|nr:sugar ABC transporter substrate-binding protein [candidate division KSB1 bacterium]
MLLKTFKILCIFMLIGLASYWLFIDTIRHYWGSEDQELRVSFWGSYMEYKMWLDIIAAFEKEHPEIRVKPMYILGAYEAKIQKQMLSRSAPDIITFQDEPFQRFVRSGNFEDLTPYMSSPGYSIDLDADYWDTAVKSFQYEDRQYAIPIWGGNNQIFYNKKLFRELGVPFPAEDWTMDDFMQTCRQLTRDVDGDGRIDIFAYQVPDWVYSLPFVWSTGGRVLDESRQYWCYDSPEILNYFTFVQEMIHKYRHSPRAVDIANMNTDIAFLTGRVAMFCSGPWAMPFLRETNIEYGVVNIPKGAGGQRWTRVSWDALTIFKGSRQKEKAWIFIHFVASMTAQQIIADYHRSLPALKETESYIRSKYPQSPFNQFIFALSYSRIQPITVRWNEMARVIARHWGYLTNNEISPEETIRNIKSEILQKKIFREMEPKK